MIINLIFLYFGYNLKFSWEIDDHNRDYLKYTNDIYFFVSRFVRHRLLSISETPLASIKNIFENPQNGVELLKNVTSPQRYGRK